MWARAADYFAPGSSLGIRTTSQADVHPPFPFPKTTNIVLGLAGLVVALMLAHRFLAKGGK